MSQHKIFGTDGIRNCVGQGLMTPDSLVKLGWAIGKSLSNQAEKPLIVIGKDTRVSGYMIESALEAGLSYANTNIYLVGPMPTPGLSFLTQELGAQAGIMISASHNPFQDNGVKLFNAAGGKLSDAQEALITKIFYQPMQPCQSSYRLGKAKRVNDASTRYMTHCTSLLPLGQPLKGLKLVIDCAQGAAYQVAPMIFEDLGAQVIAIANQPDGFNINLNCGSTHPKSLQEAVLYHHADCGIALDGDADRIIMVNEQGQICDGDDLLYLLSIYTPRHIEKTTGVVGTIMTNMALELALKENGINFCRTEVGDRYVAQELSQRGWRLGGEPSGHIIYTDHAKTGDGILAGMMVMQILINNNSSLSTLLAPFIKWPQISYNIDKKEGLPWKQTSQLQKLTAFWQEKLGPLARIVIRESGTQACIRLMVEAPDHELAEIAADELKEYLEPILSQS